MAKRNKKTHGNDTQVKSTDKPKIKFLEMLKKSIERSKKKRLEKRIEKEVKNREAGKKIAWKLDDIISKKSESYPTVYIIDEKHPEWGKVHVQVRSPHVEVNGERVNNIGFLYHTSRRYYGGSLEGENRGKKDKYGRFHPNVIEVDPEDETIKELLNKGKIYVDKETYKEPVVIIKINTKTFKQLHNSMLDQFFRTYTYKMVLARLHSDSKDAWEQKLRWIRDENKRMRVAEHTDNINRFAKKALLAILYTAGRPMVKHNLVTKEEKKEIKKVLDDILPEMGYEQAYKLVREVGKAVKAHLAKDNPNREKYAINLARFITENLPGRRYGITKTPPEKIAEDLLRVTENAIELDEIRKAGKGVRDYEKILKAQKENIERLRKKLKEEKNKKPVSVKNKKVRRHVR